MNGKTSSERITFDRWLLYLDCPRVAKETGQSVHVATEYIRGCLSSFAPITVEQVVDMAAMRALKERGRGY